MSKSVKHGNAKELDQFYTLPEYAKQFYADIANTVDLDRAGLLLEPSAGAGSFFELLDPQRRLGLDLDPQAAGIVKTDFLDWQPPEDTVIYTIGNPPFGKNSNLAVQFFNRAAEFSDVIAFVLPRTFRKHSLVNRLNRDFHCVYDKTVPENSFVYENKPYDVWCCAQIWQRQKNQRDLHKILKLSDFSDLFDVVEPTDADFAIQRVGGRAGLIRTTNFDSYSTESHYFIRQKDPRVLDCFRACDFDRVKYNTVGNPSISPSELLELFVEQASLAGIEITFGHGLFSQ